MLPALNYRPWYALAEFVDNSLQSFLAHRAELMPLNQEGAPLRVEIELDATNDTMVIRDNAAGISAADYPRAFRPGERPPDATGLSEFGMGMKSAACWFGRSFSVRTKALGEDVERTISFDIEAIVRDKIETVQPQIVPAEPTHHYTEIILRDLYKTPQGMTIGKMKKHLASIFRVFIRDGILSLRFNSESLYPEDPEVLVAPHYRDDDGKPLVWRKEIDIDLGGGLSAVGFCAIRRTASTSLAGLSLFRRGRLIQGSGDETYRPRFIFADPNGFVYQRVFGELHLEGFKVSHTKDGFLWEENEEPFLELLKERLDAAPLPLLQQAREYRVRHRPADLRTGAEEATEHTTEAVRADPQVLSDQVEAHPEPEPLPPSLPPTELAAAREIQIELGASRWRISVELSTDPAIGEWLTIFDTVPAEVGAEERRIGIRLCLAHPFMDRFGGEDAARIEPLLRVAVAFGLGEIAARESGVRMAGVIRSNANELLRGPLSRP